jgi:cysteine-rich repeat protein
MRRTFLLRVLLATSLVGVSFVEVACGSGDESTGKKAAPGDGGAANGGTSGASGAGTAGVSSDASESGPGGASGFSGASGASGGSGATGFDGGEDGDASLTDVAIDVPVSTTCGDAIRDPVTEECDDGTGLAPPDSCTADCRVEDVLVVGSVPDSGFIVTRSLGLGRHTVAAGVSGSAVVFIDASSTPRAVKLRAFDANGVPGNLVTVAADASILPQSDPVIAAVPLGKYAVAYMDLGLDGDQQGVALRIVDPASSSVSTLVRVNASTLGNQRDPELIWTGSELVVAFVDEGNFGPTATDVRVRRCSESGAALDSGKPLAETNDFEGKVALTPFASAPGYASAWMSLSLSAHVVWAKAGTATWSFSMAPPTDGESQPSIVALDATHLFLAFVEGGGSFATPRLRGAILDTAQPGTFTPFDIAPLTEPYASDASLGQSQPAVSAVGSSVFVAWKSETIPLSLEGGELWLKELPWSVSSGAVTLDLSHAEIPLPRKNDHVPGHQDFPALATTPLFPGGALVTAWEDSGNVFGANEGDPDVIFEQIPIPIVRLPSEGGLP